MTEARKMPEQKPGRSEQVVSTPWELIDAVERRFGAITFDLAATCENKKVRHDHRFYGPGSEIAEDAMTQDWRLQTGVSWLNPPFGVLSPWVEKCWDTSNDPGWLGKILLLVPASVGSNWWLKFVHKKAAVFFLNPRVTFEGHDQVYPKDLALCVYGLTPGYDCWRWNMQEIR